MTSSSGRPMPTAAKIMWNASDNVIWSRAAVSVSIGRIPSVGGRALLEGRIRPEASLGVSRSLYAASSAEPTCRVPDRPTTVNSLDGGPTARDNKPFRSVLRDDLAIRPRVALARFAALTRRSGQELSPMLHRIPPRMGMAAWGALGVFAVALAFPGTGLAQVAAEKSAALLKPADGLEATLWASEPMVHNPTNTDVDSRGRVWVTEGINYRLYRNNGMPRVEEADKIKFLEDTDGDGKADKMTVFADKIFPVPMGLAVEERYGKDGKYLGCPRLRRE